MGNDRCRCINRHLPGHKRCDHPFFGVGPNRPFRLVKGRWFPGTPAFLEAAIASTKPAIESAQHHPATPRALSTTPTSTLPGCKASAKVTPILNCCGNDPERVKTQSVRSDGKNSSKTCSYMELSSLNGGE